ncbi:MULTISPECIES: hypothetical protein [unclassified Streptomyces]|uniref:hypothetical protein n=1 Tax=unclassified Streptomyces TaxID=2593676 RepID=UPI00093A19F7|nr:hypothetical protein [Streptomyces sp. TSRI0107]OKJ80450.1 hypothetical protein AMK31_25140 [Streptomyces sp. TSRI0107]
MGTVVLSGAAVLVVLGFGNSLYWLAAAALLFLYVRSGRDATTPTPPTGAGSAPATYQDYRERRDQQAKWERRYRRERPLEARRQEREKSG